MKTFFFTFFIFCIHYTIQDTYEDQNNVALFWIVVVAFQIWLAIIQSKKE